MRIFRSLDEIRGAVADPVVTVGSFDGVHAGHRRILGESGRIARERRGESVVVTFDPHPRRVVHNADSPVRYLNTVEEKSLLLEMAGVDDLFVINFTPEFAALSPAEFVRRYLVEGIGAKVLVTGYDHHFGRDREGDSDYLDRCGFSVVQIPEVDVETDRVSSTVIRGLIAKGDMASANRLLTVPYIMIVRPDKEGFFTVDADKALPPDGVWPVTVESEGRRVEGELKIEDGKLHLENFPVPVTEKAIVFFNA